MMRHLRPPADGRETRDGSDDEMTVEIDTRAIPGIGEICWRLEDGCHVVTVTDDEGAVAASLVADDGETARELFRHPFARLSVPDLFARRRAAA